MFTPGKPPVDYQGARDVTPIAEFALQQVCLNLFHLYYKLIYDILQIFLPCGCKSFSLGWIICVTVRLSSVNKKGLNFF